jgi:hypothetical protein
MLAKAHVQLCQIVAGSRDMHFERYQKDNFLYESLTTGICHAYCGIVDWKGRSLRGCWSRMNPSVIET